MRYLYNYDKELNLAEYSKIAFDPIKTPIELATIMPVIDEIDKVYTQAKQIDDIKYYYYMDKILGLAFAENEPKFDKLDKKFREISLIPQYLSIKISLLHIYNIRMSYIANKDFNKHYLIYSYGTNTVLAQTNFKNRTKMELEDFFDQYDRELTQAISAKISNPDAVLPKASPELIALKKTLSYR